MPTDTKVETPRTDALSDKVEARCQGEGNSTDRLVIRGRYLVDALRLAAELERELEEARKRIGELEVTEHRYNKLRNRGEYGVVCSETGPDEYGYEWVTGETLDRFVDALKDSP